MVSRRSSTASDTASVTAQPKKEVKAVQPRNLVARVINIAASGETVATAILRTIRDIPDVVEKYIGISEKIFPRQDSLTWEYYDKLDELQDIQGAIATLLDKIRTIEMNVPKPLPEKIEKQVIELHKELSKKIRQFYYLDKKKIERTYYALANTITTTLTGPLATRPVMEKIIILVGPGSGINIELLDSLLQEPLSMFTKIGRQLKNRCLLSCCRPTLPAPPLPFGIKTPYCFEFKDVIDDDDQSIIEESITDTDISADDSAEPQPHISSTTTVPDTLIPKIPEVELNAPTISTTQLPTKKSTSTFAKSLNTFANICMFVDEYLLQHAPYGTYDII